MVKGLFYALTGRAAFLFRGNVGYAVRGLFVAVLRTVSPVFWHGRRQTVLAIIVQRCLLCSVPLPQVEPAMRTSRQRREEPMHLLGVAAPSCQAEEVVCHRRR